MIYFIIIKRPSSMTVKLTNINIHPYLCIWASVSFSSSQRSPAISLRSCFLWTLPFCSRLSTLLYCSARAWRLDRRSCKICTWSNFVKSIFYQIIILKLGSLKRGYQTIKISENRIEIPCELFELWHFEFFEKNANFWYF